MPSPQVAAVAVMALLAFGVVIGSVTSPFAQSAGVAPIVLEMAEAGPAASRPNPRAKSRLRGRNRPRRPLTAEPVAPPAKRRRPNRCPKPRRRRNSLRNCPKNRRCRRINHVFLIVLGDHGYEEAFGTTSSAPYLSKTLAGQGELLSNYYAVAQGELANEVALLSGQGPTPQTAVNCPEYTDDRPRHGRRRRTGRRQRLRLSGRRP